MGLLSLHPYVILTDYFFAENRESITMFGIIVLKACKEADYVRRGVICSKTVNKHRDTQINYSINVNNPLFHVIVKIYLCFLSY